MQSSNRPLTLGEWTLRIGVAVLLGILVLAAWELRDALLLAFLAAIVAIVLQVPVQRLERLGLSRGLSILTSMLGVAAVLTLALILIIPIFANQVADLADELPDLLDEARAEYDRQMQTRDWLPDIDWDNVTEGDASDFLLNQSGQLTRNIFPFLSGVGGALTSFIFMLFIAVFFVTDPANYLEGLLTLVPSGYRPRALEILTKLGGMLQRWFLGQLISMTLSGVFIAFLTGVILKLPNAVALGVIAGVMEFVPNFGSILAVIPAIVIALAEDPVLVPFTIVGYLVVQQIQSNIIMPRIMSRQVSIPAATILIAQLISAALFGFMGLLLAVPLMVVVKVLVSEIYVTDILNARPAEIQMRARSDGTLFMAVTTAPSRPPQLTPGQAAQLKAEGQDLFATDGGQIVEIITPPSPALEEAARGQQAVWVAILALTVAQGIALVRTLLGGRD
ncbi:MAG: AI-2E family transporter [Anaerolineae bacterium]|nr:AI-2E family transporter [Anaerolineae bacterium]